jgi:DtxR family transcriptional regulator, Mn-dependent transcriptional regulator
MPTNIILLSKTEDRLMENQTTVSPNYTSAIDDYLKAIYCLSQEHGDVTTTLLATYFGFAPPSVTGMVQKLAKLNLVHYTRYQGVILTPQGQRQALKVLRHHRLIELFLVQTLGYSWEEVHAEAELLEHVLSHTLEARITAHLGDPAVDPHGDPIPRPDGTLPDIPTQSLAELPIGALGEIAQITDQQPAHLCYFAELGLIPGARITVLAQAPFDGPVTIGIDMATHHLDNRMARAILVHAAPADVQRSLAA